jgi:hypothetical protein
MQSSDEGPSWDFSPAIDLLKTLSFSDPRENQSSTHDPSEECSDSHPPLILSQAKDEDLSLGNFNRIWEYLSLSHNKGNRFEERPLEEDDERVAKEVRWRDEVSGADLEDNVDIQYINTPSLKTLQRSARRRRAKERQIQAAASQINSYETDSDSATDNGSGKEELERLRRHSPNRRAVIQDILRHSSNNGTEIPSPPTSPSPPKESLRVLRKDGPVSNPFQWSATTSHAASHRNQILPLGNLTKEQRKSRLIARLAERYAPEAKYLKNKGLVHPEFTPLNTSDSGIHVFIDISNVCLHYVKKSPLFVKQWYRS